MRFVFLLPFMVGAAMAQDASVSKCRAIADTAQRLACYDSLTPVAKPSTSEAAKLAVPEVPKVQLIETGPASRADKSAAALFGLEVQVQRTQAERIDTSIEGRFEGWEAKTEIAFKNGQVWQVTDGSRAVLNMNNPKVSIRRGVFGVFYLEVEGLGRTASVRRVK